MTRQEWIMCLVAGALALLLLFGGLALRDWCAGATVALQRAERQYAEQLGQIARYRALRGRTAAEQPARNLFGMVNDTAAGLGLSACIETLRPTVSEERGMAFLDVRLRGLYLGECMRWIQAMEGAAAIVSLNLVRTDNGLLDADMRLAHSMEKRP